MPFPADTACLKERGIQFAADLPRPFDPATTPNISYIRHWTGEGDAPVLSLPVVARRYMFMPAWQRSPCLMPNDGGLPAVLCHLIYGREFKGSLCKPQSSAWAPNSPMHNCHAHV